MCSCKSADDGFTKIKLVRYGKKKQKKKKTVYSWFYFMYSVNTLGTVKLLGLFK